MGPTEFFACTTERSTDVTTRRPPVIPEIAKAYQNDPRTLLARAALQAGASTAPVAEGKYAWADGLARALQGVAGGYIDKKAQDRYGQDEQTLLAQRQARGVDGMSGAPAPMTPPFAPSAVPGGSPAAQAAPAQASAIAAALGSPQVPQTPPGPAQGAPPAIPMAPVPALAGPAGVQPPAQGGGLAGRRPFGQGTPSSAPSGPSYLQAPVPETVPDAPAPVARPGMPDAVGPTRSKLLDAAYKIMADANPYESASGQDLYGQGLSDQDKLNEAAATRKQHLIDMQYGTDSDIYANAASQDRGAAIKGREDVIARNAQALETYKGRQFEYGVHKEDQAFTAGENAKNRANAIAVANIKERSPSGGGAGAWGLTDDERAALSKAAGEGRVDVTRLNSRTAKIQAQIFLANPGFDAMTNHGAAALIGNAPAQQKAMMAAMLPDVLGNVRDAGKKLKFSDAQFIGKLQAFGKGQLNDPDFTMYMTQRNDAMQTLAQVMSGVGATDMRTKMESDAAPKTMSPKAWDAWYQGQLNALRPRISQYEQHRLLPAGTTEHVAPQAVQTGPYSDPAKEARYQAWLRANGH